jgi:hypothetical protein
VTLPQWARDILSSPPPAGSGFHGWIFRAAKALSRCGRDEHEIRAILETAAAGCGRRVPPREIEDAIKNGILSAAKRQPYVAAKAWPGIDHAARNLILQRGAGLKDLIADSPVKPDETHDAEWFIDALFPADSLICAGEDNDSAHTRRRDEWRGELGNMQYIVPSPMTATQGTNLQGVVSKRCLNNTGPRRFLIIESDHGTADEQAAVLLHLAATAPLGSTPPDNPNPSSAASCNAPSESAPTTTPSPAASSCACRKATTAKPATGSESSTTHPR